MPQAVTKITYDDGTEDSFGPVEVPKKVAQEIASALRPLEDKRQEQLEKARIQEAVEEQEKRSREAERANQARIKAAGAEGVKE